MAANTTAPGRPRRVVGRRLVGAALALSTILTTASCSSEDQSTFLYRLPYASGTEIAIWQDHLTHAMAIDMAGTNGAGPYSVVAARSGVIRFIEDGESVNCEPGGTCDNNYVWIQHDPGLEWTKYSHLAQFSVSNAGWEVGDEIAQGQFLGFEANVGQAAGSNNGTHLHFEVREVTAGTTPSARTGWLPGPRRMPRFCTVIDQVVRQHEIYETGSCP